MASPGNMLIFSTSFGYMEPMLKAAEEFKAVKFEHATGYKQTDNLRSYDSRSYMGAYMAGIIAGKMTKSNILGVVGSIPVPEVVRNINAYTLGAQSVYPKVKTKVVWVGSWFDPPKETEAAQSLINGGADVLLQNTDSTAVLQTAERNKKYAFGWDSDMSKFAPNAHLGRQDSHLVGREGRRQRHRRHQRRGARRSAGPGGHHQSRAGRRQVHGRHAFLGEGRGRQGAQR